MLTLGTRSGPACHSVCAEYVRLRQPSELRRLSLEWKLPCEGFGGSYYNGLLSVRIVLLALKSMCLIEAALTRTSSRLPLSVNPENLVLQSCSGMRFLCVARNSLEDHMRTLLSRANYRCEQLHGWVEIAFKPVYWQDSLSHTSR